MAEGRQNEACPTCGSPVYVVTSDETAHYRSLYEFDVTVPIADLREALLQIRELVDEQAEDEGLWSVPLVAGAQPIVEAYLQQELHRLHARVENVTAGLA